VTASEIGDGSSRGDKLDIDAGSKDGFEDGFEDGALLGVKLGMGKGHVVMEMASKRAAEIASKMYLFLLMARLIKVLKKASKMACHLVSCSALTKGCYRRLQSWLQ
jgi:hypothetical protein